jgi:uncharacterized protein
MEINPIIKEVTTDCNLRCKYCFFAKQKRRKERIDLTTLEMVIKNICRCNPANKEIMFYWHGGEPLLAGVEFYRQAVALQQNFKKAGQRIRNGLETNATLLNKRWAEFFKETGFEVGVSLDGPAKYHNYYRCYPDGRGSFKDVIRGIEILKEEDIKFSVIAVINKRSVSAPREIFDFFSSSRISNSVNLVPALGIKTGHGLSFECSVKPASYVDFLIKVFELWLISGNAKLSILPLESIIRAFMGFPQGDCRFAGECTKSVVIESNGDIFACNTYGYGDFFKFGNIKNGIASAINLKTSEKYRNYLEFLEKIRNQCTRCEWYKVCRGGCSGWYYLGKGKNIFCKDLKRLFIHIQKVLEDQKVIKIGA